MRRRRRSPFPDDSGDSPVGDWFQGDDDRCRDERDEDGYDYGDRRGRQFLFRFRGFVLIRHRGDRCGGERDRIETFRESGDDGFRAGDARGELSGVRRGLSCWMSGRTVMSRVIRVVPGTNESPVGRGALPAVRICFPGDTAFDRLQGRFFIQ